MIYEYKCESCSEVSEFWMKMSDPHPETCPRCSQEGKLERVISQSSFALKGSGWYTSDYKRSGSQGNSGGSCPSGGCAAD